MSCRAISARPTALCSPPHPPLLHRHFLFSVASHDVAGDVCEAPGAGGRVVGRFGAHRNTRIDFLLVDPRIGLLVTVVGRRRLTQLNIPWQRLYLSA